MISVTLLTKNSAQYLPKVLEALTSFDEILVLDSGSTDDTLTIASQFSNVSIHHHNFDGFGPAHRKATALAKHDWILSIDSDEVASPELVHEIQTMPLQETCVYAFPRYTYYNGQLIKWCGWYPDDQTRLYNRKVTGFTNAKVHETVITEGLKKVKLKHPMRHYSYETTEDFLAKMQTYSTLFAEQNRGKKNSSLCKAALHGAFAFLKSYLIKRGFLGGRIGFVISIYNANTAFYKYLKLAEVNKS